MALSYFAAGCRGMRRQQLEMIRQRLGWEEQRVRDDVVEVRKAYERESSPLGALAFGVVAKSKKSGFIRLRTPINWLRGAQITPSTRFQCSFCLIFLSIRTCPYMA